MRAVVFSSLLSLARSLSLSLSLCLFSFSLFSFFFTPQETTVRLIYRDMADFHGNFQNFSLPYFGSRRARQVRDSLRIRFPKTLLNSGTSPDINSNRIKGLSIETSSLYRMDIG